MALEWALRSSCARDALDEADEVLGFNLSALMRAGPADELDDTAQAQPAMLAASVAILRAVSDELPEPAFVAGHSMGEYGALVAAGSLGYPDALGLVRERGRLMARAGARSPGRMAAVLGLDDDVVESACAGIDGVQVANYNSPGQVVISGAAAAVDEASERLRSAGAKRVVPLAVSIAAHSALMGSVADDFAEAVGRAVVLPARPALVANITARPIDQPDELRRELAASLQNPVRWSESVRWMHGQGVRRFVEIGPGSVLTGLVKRTLRGADDVTTSSLAEPVEVA
jgi:[acyl-carrier-protein] S-malonyltransferase